MATSSKARYGFIREAGSGKAEQFRNVKTGELISRRQFDKARRLATIGEETSNEKLAKFNREINAEEAASRPARNKTSLRKLAPATRSEIAKARIAHEKELIEIEKRKQEEKRVARKIEEKKRKKVKPKKISARLLKPGTAGAQIPFNDYEEYEDLQKQAKASGKIVAYGLGLVAVDTRTGKTVSPTVFTLQEVNNVIEEDDFYESMEAMLEAKSYMVLMHYYMHLAFKKSFSEQHAVTSKQKRKPRAKHKSKRK